MIKRYDFKIWQNLINEDLVNKQKTADFSMNNWKEGWSKKIKEREERDKKFVVTVLWISTFVSAIISLLILHSYDFHINLSDFSVQSIVLSLNLAFYASLNLIHVDLRIWFYNKCIQYVDVL